MIDDIFQLCGEIFGSTERAGGDSDRAQSMIQKALFKGTECGICFRVFDANAPLDHHTLELAEDLMCIEYDSRICVGVAGYAEGCDDNCEEIVLKMGDFTIEEFWAAVTQADEEGVAMFEEWNDPQGGYWGPI
jgi:hypothetical protein